MSSAPRSPAIPALLPLIFLGACAGPTGYPSLQPRAIENLSLAEPVTPAPKPAVVTPEQASAYADAIARAQKADAAFRTALAEERPTLLRGKSAAPGSDAWTDAQESLTRIETLRNPLTAILADLDAGRDTDETRANSNLMAAATAAFETVHKIDESEIKALAAVRPPNS